LKEHTLRAEEKSRRKWREVRFGFKERTFVNNYPSVTTYSTIDPLKPDDKRRIGTSARQDAIEQQAALKAVAIGQAQTAQPQHNRSQPPFGLTITRPDRRTPSAPYEPCQRYQVFEQSKH
jgi:hypothetical protein